MRLTIAIALPCLVGCLISNASAEETFRDRSLSGGLDLSAPTANARSYRADTILQEEPGARQEWMLEQLGSRVDLAGSRELKLRGGTRLIENAAKKITVYDGGLAGKGVKLEIDGGAEYGDRLRRDGEPWPSLALKQRIPKNLSLDQGSNLAFKLSFRIESCSLVPSEGVLDPGLHNARLSAVWTLHNRNAESEDYLDKMEFGLPLFDAQNDVPPGRHTVDSEKFTKEDTFTCMVEGKRFFNRSTGDGGWHDIDCNLLPLMEEALAAAQSEGLFTNTSLSDLHVTSFNVGWEVPGPYDCGATVKGLSLDVNELKMSDASKGRY